MPDAVVVRAYTCADEVACLTLFDGNTPAFFAPHERSEFEAYLRGATDGVLVAEDRDAGIVGVGGYYIRRDGPDGAEGGLAWGMVARAWHRRGVGTTLLHARLRALAAAGATAVSVRTSQHSRGFFEHAGFVAVREVPDGFAPGIDLVELRR